MNFLTKISFQILEMLLNYYQDLLFYSSYLFHSFID